MIHEILYKAKIKIKVGNLCFKFNNSQILCNTKASNGKASSAEQRFVMRCCVGQRENNRVATSS